VLAFGGEKTGLTSFSPTYLPPSTYGLYSKDLDYGVFESLRGLKFPGRRNLSLRKADVQLLRRLRVIYHVYASDDVEHRMH
jgi:hypothetical protein